ncbi:alpha/beta fold hydrolase [Mycobacterium sp. SMC-4]|uniref:alpha/beta fold hydrolase n=1 Tax=Mycobacterium sp. SMC-4 TaxID=2857059 RepID=UPI0021B3327B|nr:alpha/beta fold hydrolase [Mycobacterium sp. SMC-4]UXA20573.1 alpha/beta fold hydrolase [Mycobacterium sp. SMC-4]
MAGMLYHPLATPPPYPCVVFAHGFSGTMDWILPDFARVFAAAGLAVLTFDYRHFGLSEGQPRQLVDPDLQLADIRAALAYTRTLDMVDGRRVALWGTSLGGSHVVTIAAADPGIAAVVANVPALDLYAGLRGRFRSRDYRPGLTRSIGATVRLTVAAVIDSLRGQFGFPPHYVAVYGRLGRAVFSDPALAPLFADVEIHSPTWRNAVTPRFLFHAPRYRRGTIEAIRCPVLVTLARDDAEISTPWIKHTVGRAACVEINEYPVGHFDIYHGAVRDRVAFDQRSFLVRHLAATR